MTASHVQALVDQVRLIRAKVHAHNRGGDLYRGLRDEVRNICDGALAAFEAAESAQPSTAPHIQTLVAAARAVCDNAESDEEEPGISAVDSGDLKALKFALDALAAPPSSAAGEWQRVDAEHPLPRDLQKGDEVAFKLAFADNGLNPLESDRSYAARDDISAYRRNTAPPKSVIPIND